MLLYFKKRKHWLHVIFWLQHPDLSYARCHCIWQIEIAEIQINLNVNPPMSFTYCTEGVTQRRSHWNVDVGRESKITKHSLQNIWTKPEKFSLVFQKKACCIVTIWEKVKGWVSIPISQNPLWHRYPRGQGL